MTQSNDHDLQPRSAGQPLVDGQLLGAWSKDRLASDHGPDDTRIIYFADGTGRYETWHHGLNECVTFHWQIEAIGWVSMRGMEYLFRQGDQIRREPCDWDFPDCRYEVAAEALPDGSGPAPVLHLHLGGGRCDHYGLLARDAELFREPLWNDHRA